MFSGAGAKQYLDDVKNAAENGRGADTAHARSIVAQVSDQIIEPLKIYSNGNRRSQYIHIIKEVGYAETTVIALRTIFTMVMANPEPCNRTSVAHAIGSALQLELKLRSIKKDSPKYLKEVQRDWKRRKANSVRHKNNVASKILKNNNLHWENWDNKIKVAVGSLMLEFILANSDIFTSFTLRRSSKITISYIAFSDKADKWLDDHQQWKALMNPMTRPMIVPPTDWTKGKPYVTDEMNTAINFVRTRSKALRKKYSTVSPVMLERVSKLQSTPWRINAKILKFTQDLRIMGDSGIIPPRNQANTPPYPFGDRDVQDLSDAERTAFTEWKSICRSIHNDEVSRRSNRQRTLQIVSIAEDFRHYDNLYFPHSVDTRGRVYSIPVILNPQGDDLCKGILEFSNGQVLTDDGVTQLKLQIASKYGLDKESYDERLAWFDSQESYLLDVANNPRNHLGFLRGADKPFQTLAGLFDYATWKKDPQAVIHARVNKDGACNGLQHFSAMLTDGDVGDSVNLTKAKSSDAPKSIYKVIADEVQMLLEKDGSIEAQVWLEFWKIHGRDGKVDYKCMKRPVMTLPYSATMYSRMEYIKDYIRDKGGHTFFGDKFGNSVFMLAKLVTEAMNRRISSASLILDWLRDACSDIMQSHESVDWDTPDGFTVFNRKDKQSRRSITIQFEGRRIAYSYRQDDEDKPDIRSMASAIAPNFVHSMDACHLLRVVNECHNQGITDIHLVHDDYGCHVNHGKRLAHIARSTFADMYIDNFPLEDFYNKYKDVIKSPPPPQIATLNLQETRESLYSFD